VSAMAFEYTVSDTTYNSKFSEQAVFHSLEQIVTFFLKKTASDNWDFYLKA
jgi:hypothetical protein